MQRIRETRDQSIAMRGRDRGQMNAELYREHKVPLTVAIACVALLGLCAQTALNAPDAKPYDDKLLRLSEILGAVHYLRELCGASDGQLWRDRMKELMDTEGASALRRNKLTRSFNNGYRSYSRTYNSCTPSAQTAITRFLSEGAEIAESLTKTVP
jgi:uncharacterized protein (TIGR02301 family)